MDQLEQDLDVNKLPQNYPCVTTSELSTADHQRKRPSESSSPSDNLRAERGSSENQKKSATEHDEVDVQVIEATSSLASSSGYISGESLERQSREAVTIAVTGGQIGPCVRTVAETTPMPDLFAQDEDGDT